MAVKATTITISGDTNPARIAASPTINAPTILTAEPITLGSLRPASRRVSKANSMPKASTNAGNGTPSLWAATARIRGVGSIS